MAYYDAELGGVPLHCQTTRDGFDKAIAVHEAPYKDGAETEDLGFTARAISLHCVFYGDNYADHIDLVSAISDGNVLQFVHPIYGTLKVRCKGCTINNNEQAEQADVDLELIEDGTPTAEVKSITAASAVKAAQQAFSDNNDATVDNITDKIAAAGNVSSSLSLSDITGAVASFEAVMSTVTNPATSLVSLVEYASDVPGQLCEAVQKAVERVAESYRTLSTAPDTFIAKLEESYSELIDSFEDFKAETSAACAVRMALEVSGIFAAAETAQASINTAAESEFDAAGNLTAATTDETELLNSLQIDRILNSANTIINVAVVADPSNAALKTISAALISSARAIKAKAEVVKTVHISEQTPIMLVLLQNNLPYTAADAVLKLNPDIKDANRIQGDVKIYVR